MKPELESIYQTAPIGLAVLDTQLRFLRVNDRLAEINGLPVEAHIGRTWHEVLPHVTQQAEAALRQVATTGQPLRHLEMRGSTRAKPGVECIWSVQIAPLRNAAGKVERLSVVIEDITERRRAQEALQRSQEKFELAMEATGQAMWEWHIPSDRLRFTGNWSQILGYHPDDDADTHARWMAQTNPADRDRTNAGLQAHVRGETPAYESEFRMRRADGSWVWLGSRGRVVQRDEAGRALRMVGVARDISAQRHDQEELRQRAQLLQMSFDAIFVWSPEHGIEFWNRGAELQYGYSAAEAIGAHPNALLKTVFPGGEAAMAQALASQGLWRGELLHERKDGRRITVAAALQRVGEGRQRVLEITRDISDRKAQEAQLLARERELSRSQQRLQIALEAGRMGVWDWTAGSEDAFCSPEVYRLLGLAPPSPDQPMETLRLLQMVHPEDRPRLDAEVARVLTKGGDYEVEFRVVRADGEVRWLVSRGRVMHDTEGPPSRMVGVNFDITERKLIEQAMREADTRRTEFLAMLAHELRNPLAPISNAVRLLERIGGEPDRREAATQILRRQTRHMARLVDDLLEVSRITQGRIELRMENTLVATSVTQAVEAARPQARERHQTIEVSVPPALDLVADPARLTQIVSNLVTNAVKYTPEGGHIEITAKEEPGHWLTISVQDDGPGITADLLPRVFDLFTQDKRTLDRSQGGLGIGLALVKRLTELHGGHVRCESAGPGSGARFVVCLPRNGRREELRGSPVTGTPTRLSPMPILVVDDNIDAAQTLASLLRLDGHRVEVALDAARQLRPRVVLLDLGLPRLDGLEVARQLRADPSTEHAVLIAMSGYAQASDRAASAAAGFDAHLAKPVELADIYAAVESGLRQPA